MNQHFTVLEEKCSPDIRFSVQNCSSLKKYYTSYGPGQTNLPVTEEVKYTARLGYDDGTYFSLKMEFENSSYEEKKFDFCVQIFNPSSMDRPLKTECFGAIELAPKSDYEETLVERVDLDEIPDLIINDQCDIVVRVAQFSVKEKIYNSDNIQSSLMPELSTMYQDDTFKDVKFLVNGQTIRAHKTVLATRSKVFHSMFASDMKEKRSGVVKIQDFTVAAFEKFIKYLYTNETEGMEEMAEELMLIADKYDIQCLRNQCENYYLCLKMEVNDAIHFLLIGEKFNFTALKQRALFLIKSNPEVIKSPEFSKLFQYSDLQEDFVRQIFNDTNVANDEVRVAILNGIIKKLSS